MQAFDESIIIEVQARRAGEEIKSELGIVLGRLEQGEVPDLGTVISVGSGIPSAAAEQLLNKQVIIPNGRMTHVVDPRVVAGQFVKEENRRQLIATHWKNIQVIY